MKDIKEILTVENWDNEVALSHYCDESDLKNDMKNIKRVIKALKDTMEAKQLTALSAPAIGENQRIFCIRFKDEIKSFINPIISSCEGITLATETCTSIPNKRFIRPRNNKIGIVYMRPTGQIETRDEIVGVTAYIIQHEIDHLNGTIISDIGLEIDDDFDKASDEEKQEIITEYLTSLDIKQKQLEAEIEEDPDLKKLSDGIKFMTGVAKGEIKLETEEGVK